MFSQKFWNQVEEEIKAGYINVQKHPTEGLWIYNYSQSAMLDGHWTEATMTCRGLIVDGNKNIVSRPFKKFMTKEQCESFNIKIPYEEEFEVYSKEDGSLGVMYFILKTDIPYGFGYDCHEGPFIATRGSFTSDQAVEANKILKEKYSRVNFNPDYTYLFEIIYPNNRIVVDYGNKRDLILLAIIDTKTGIELPVSLGTAMGLNVVTRYHGIKDFNKVLDNFQKFKGTEFEGLVICFKSGFRVKIKTDDYKRLHKILTGINEKRIHECISSGQGLQEILSVVDDAFVSWIKSVEHVLMISYNATEGVSKLMFEDALKYADGKGNFMVDPEDSKKLHRKNFAKFVSNCDSAVIKSVCFQMYGNMDYKNIIWKSLEPRGDQKFKMIEEE